MKYKGLILIVIVALAAAAILFLPETKVYKEIATIGSSAPNFQLKDSNGTVWKLSDLRGKVVFINFWATWCTVCKAEMAYKESLFKKMQGKPFQIYKFRTMTDERGADGALLPDAERLVPFGRFLRSTSLDELPELINVLKGDMSLVGPRPLLLEYLDRYTPEQTRRHDLRPGRRSLSQTREFRAARRCG